jgi:hypothetical protein
VHRTGPRRLISALLLLGFSLAFAAPVFALYSAEAEKMACCRRGAGGCCKHHAKQRTEPGFAAENGCARQCSLGAESAQMGASLAPLSETAAVESCAHCLPVAAPEEAYSRSTAYPAFLYELPPPPSTR